MIKQIYQKIRNLILFDREKALPTYEEELAFFAAQPAPQDAVDQAYIKYRCMTWYNYPKRIRGLFHAVSFVMLPFCRLYYTVKGVSAPKDADRKTAVLRVNPVIGYEDILPDGLIDEGDTALIRSYKMSRGVLTPEAKALYLESSRRYPHAYYFRLLTLLKLAEYGGWMQTYAPEKIVVYANERDFVLPLKTALCEQNGVSHISFMHGDLTFSIEKSYLQYSAYYLWDEHYKDMLTRVGADDTQFRIYTPEKYRLSFDGVAEPAYYLTFYFSSEKHEALRNIHRMLQALQKEGKRCKVRPHPRYSDLPFLKEVFTDIEIEDPHEVDLYDSMAKSRHIAGLKSTVLLQAYYAGKPVILDDVSDPEYLEYLRKCDYILLQKDVARFSDFGF